MSWRWPWQRRGPPKKEKNPPWIVRLLRRRGVHLSPRAEWVLGWVETIVEVGVIFWLTITFVTVRMTVPTGSMKPTIEEGDSFFVDILSYHFRDPTPGSMIVFWHLEELRITEVRAGSAAAQAGLEPGDWIVAPGYPTIGVGGEPVPSMVTLNRRIQAAQGTTLAFTVLREAVGHKTVAVAVPQGAKDLDDLGIKARVRNARYVKRLIAVGGQTVWIASDGKVMVDGAPLAQVAGRTYWTHGPGMRYGVEPTSVPQDHYFVLGDNTMNSYDSRYWGFVPVEDFIGCPFFRVWPFRRFGPMNGYFWSAL